MGQTSAAQLDWEDQHGRKSVSKTIPEDLKTQYEYASSNQRLNIGTYSDMYVRELIERIGRVEQERDSLVEMQKNLDAEVAQLIKERNQLRATRIEDGLKIAKLEDQVKRLSAPVSDDEFNQFNVQFDPDDEPMLPRSRVDAIIAARLAGKMEEHHA